MVTPIMLTSWVKSTPLFPIPHPHPAQDLPGLVDAPATAGANGKAVTKHSSKCSATGSYAQSWAIIS